MRLIDADKLMEYCLNLKEKKVDCNDIARFPTAYNVNEVVEELETKSDFYEYEDGYLRKMVVLKDAIEILRNGGVKNE